MLSEEQLKELLAIRTQMATLQAKYDQIIRFGASSAQPVPVLPPLPTAQPEVPAPGPQLQPVAAPAPIGVTAPMQPAAAPLPVAPAPAIQRPVAASTAPGPSSAAARSYATTVPAKSKTDEPERITIDSSITSNVRHTLVRILTESAKPLPFDKIYASLESTGTKLPSEKPKLVVRKLLYDKALFDVAPGGLFAIKADASVADLAPTAPVAPAATVPLAPTSGPTPALQPVSVPAVITPTKPSFDKPGAPGTASSFSSRLDAILNQ